MLTLMIIRLSGFAQQNFYLSFLFPYDNGLDDMLYYVNFGVKACNMFVNLNYACSCILVISYPFHVLFMQIYMCECFKITGVCFLVNMLRMEKPYVPVLKTGCFNFCGFADKTG
jgi:hypothetical protein